MKRAYGLFDTFNVYIKILSNKHKYLKFGKRLRYDGIDKIVNVKLLMSYELREINDELDVMGIVDTVLVQIF